MTIVVGYMPGRAGEQVLTAAVAEARIQRAPLVIVNSSTGAAYADSGLVPEAQLLATRDHLRRQELDVEVVQIPDAVAVAQSLLLEARRVSADLLVIGLRHRSRTGKFLLGSTAQTLLLQAPCNVLGVRLLDHG
ncbi:universal stress protein [Nocardioides insulae]|uniref:universal stress protein n=1 Tax=Nocardioides insulae TaxID=394734 RepID=UPI000410D300|nr:universal stress protein [Nocardioides insulae]